MYIYICVHIYAYICNNNTQSKRGLQYKKGHESGWKEDMERERQ